MRSWLPFAVGALLVWGLWGFVPKLATNRIAARSALVYDALGAALVGLVVLAALRFQLERDVRGALAATATGVLVTLGSLFFFVALQRGGKVSVVVPLTSVYPAIAVLLGVVFLGERPSPIHGLAALLALVAVLLFALA
jgi:transporter family protein